MQLAARNPSSERRFPRLSPWVAGLALLAATHAYADTYSKTVAAGSKLKLGGFHSVHEDCSSLGYPVVRVTTPPMHGTLKIGKGLAYPSFPASNPRSRCNARRVPATVVEYTPEKGYLGSDYVALDAIFPSGSERNDSYAIEVK